MKKHELKEAKISMKVTRLKAQMKLIDKQIRDLEKKRLEHFEELYLSVKDFEVTALRHLDG